MKINLKNNLSTPAILLSFVFTLMFNISKSFGNTYIYVIGEFLKWEQPWDIGGRRENRGLVYGIGFSSKWNLYSHLNLNLSAEIKGNRFDIEGFDLFLFKIKPSKADNVEFLILKTTGSLGWQFNIYKALNIEPYIGFGYRRGIRDVEEYKNFPGYVQIWRSHFIYGGLKIGREGIISQSSELYSKIGVIAPISSRLKLDRMGTTNRVNLGSIITGFFEVSFKYNIGVLSLYYEYLKFPRAEGAFVQPEIKINMIGLKAGIEN